MNLGDLGRALGLNEVAEAQLRSILATVPDAMVVFDQHGAILLFSKAAEKIFGYGPADIIGRDIGELLPGERLSPITRDAIAHASGDEGRRKVEARSRDGTLFTVALHIGEAIIGGDRLFTAFMRDLSESERAETRLRELQSELLRHSRVGVVGTMATALAHEINQPLAATTNYIEAACNLLGAEIDPRVAEVLGGAARETTRAGEIVSHLRRFVARGEIVRTLAEPGELAHQTCALAGIEAKLKGIECDVDIGQGNAQILVDAIQIQQVLLNLARNAMEALERSPAPRMIALRTVTEESSVLFTVRDNGPGLPDYCDFFKPFAGTKPDGMGLGLAICKTIVEAHDGRIWCENAPSGGAMFHFTIPRADRGARP